MCQTTAKEYVQRGPVLKQHESTHGWSGRVGSGNVCASHCSCAGWVSKIMCAVCTSASNEATLFREQPDTAMMVIASPDSGLQKWKQPTPHPKPRKLPHPLGKSSLRAWHSLCAQVRDVGASRLADRLIQF